jgi:hypothetical protein
MRRFLIAATLPAAAAILLAAVTAPAAAQSSDRVVRTFSQDFPRAAHRALVFDLNVGELQVIGADTDTISAEISVRCSEGRERERCRERAGHVELTSRERRNSLYLSIEGTSMWRSRDATVRVRLTMPEDMNAEIDFGTGELRVENLAGDLLIDMSIGEATLENVRGNLIVDMGVGEITVSMPQDVVGQVTLDNGIGETELRHRDGRNAMEGILGGTDVHWASGTGPKSVRIELNVGEIRVRLD